MNGACVTQNKMLEEDNIIYAMNENGDCRSLTLCITYKKISNTALEKCEGE